jgi:peroxiredoxin
MRLLVVRVLVAVSLLAGSASAQPPWIGVELDPSPAGGARINEVLTDSPASKAGLHKGDVVRAIAGVNIAHPDELIGAVRRAQPGERLRLQIQRGVKEQEVTVVLEARPTGSVLIGRPAPDFVPAVQAGAALPRVSSLRGQVVLIDFFATWCGPCVKAMPHIQDMHARLASRGLRVMGVSSEPAEIVRSAAGRFGVNYSLVSDDGEDISRRYQVRALPTMVVIDRRGVVRTIAVADTDAIDAAVSAALDER